MTIVETKKNTYAIGKDFVDAVAGPYKWEIYYKLSNNKKIVVYTNLETSKAKEVMDKELAKANLSIRSSNAYLNQTLNEVIDSLTK